MIAQHQKVKNLETEIKQLRECRDTDNEASAEITEGLEKENEVLEERVKELEAELEDIKASKDTSNGTLEQVTEQKKQAEARVQELE